MNVMGSKILGVSNMVVCDVCKRNKAIRKITYPTMSPVEEGTQYRGVDLFSTVNGYKYKREDIEYDICQQCWDIIAINRDYVFRMTKKTICNKVNESEEDKE